MLRFSSQKSAKKAPKAPKKSATKASPKKSPKAPKKLAKKANSPKAPKKASPKKDKARGCTAQTTAKYASRPSPPYPANECCGQTFKGNDGNYYVSKADKNGTCKWFKVQE